MNDVAYALALGLAAVFAWAGVAKLRTPRRTRRSFARLGIHPALATAVPVVEVALAIAIVVVPASAIVAAGLLGAFTAVLLRAEPGVGCACFGAAGATPVSWVHVVRNGMLAAVAMVASTATPAWPGLAAVTTAIGLALVGAVVLALAELKRATGAVLAVEVPAR